MTDSTGNPMNNPEGIKALVAKLPRKVYPQGPNGPAYYVAKDVDAAIESLTAVAGDAEVVASKAKTQARAREMLAEEYDNEGMQVTASLVRNDRLMGVHRAAIRAIVRADLAARLAAQTKMLADCFRAAGADCDGNEDWRIADRAYQAVCDLREDYNEACEELHGENGWVKRATRAEAELAAFKKGLIYMNGYRDAITDMKKYLNSKQ